jgi:uncharacterized protein YjiS (DUF1127 family)
MVLRMPIAFVMSLPAWTLERAVQPLLAQLRGLALGLQAHHRRSRDRAALAQMSNRELNDLGIGRSDIPGVVDTPARWREDRG